MFRLLAVAALVTGCGSHHTVAPPDMGFVPAFAAHDKVDILFMIDDSPGIAYIHEFVNRFPELIKALENGAAAGHPASYHLGIVSSDLGAGPYVLNNGQCHPDGDGGQLRVGSSATATPAPPVACANLALTGGVRFIDYDQIHGATNSNLDIATTFSCMSALGSSGCGFEHQLESTYRALHDPPPENAGFLRDDALLVVFWVTDEDDCSAPPDSDLFDPSPDGVAKYGALHSFRCTQFGISCGNPPMPLPSAMVGPFDDCQPLVGGPLFDVQRYIDFFARPGGVKADPSDVILASITAPPSPVGVQLTMPCADQVNTPSCPISNHSCVLATNPQFFGDPAVRVAAVVNAGATSQTFSMCNESYSQPLQDLAHKIIARLR